MRKTKRSAKQQRIERRKELQLNKKFLQMTLAQICNYLESLIGYNITVVRVPQILQQTFLPDEMYSCEDLVLLDRIFFLAECLAVTNGHIVSVVYEAGLNYFEPNVETITKKISEYIKPLFCRYPHVSLCIA